MRSFCRCSLPPLPITPHDSADADISLSLSDADAIIFADTAISISRHADDAADAMPLLFRYMLMFAYMLILSFYFARHYAMPLLPPFTPMPPRLLPFSFSLMLSFLSPRMLEVTLYLMPY